MNRNVITVGDVANIQKGMVPPVLRKEPPAWTDAAEPAQLPADGAPVVAGAPAGTASALAVQAGAPIGPGGVPIPTADDYLTKLVKYVPPEVVGSYLAIEAVVKSNVSGGHLDPLLLQRLLL